MSLSQINMFIVDDDWDVLTTVRFLLKTEAKSGLYRSLQK